MSVIAIHDAEKERIRKKTFPNYALMKISAYYKSIGYAVTIYAQAERNEREGIIPNKMQLEFAQRYVYSGKFRTESWDEYKERKGI